MLSRRNLLHCLASGSVLAGSSRLWAQGLGTDYDVIVVGAGVSGLAASDYLLSLDADLKLLILEARDRLGGRVWSVKHAHSNRRAELGALYFPGQSSDQPAPFDKLELNAELLANGQHELLPGMTALIDALGASSDGQVQLNSVVSEIYWREGLVGVGYQNRGLNSSVTCRRLLLSLPAPVLRASSINIVPPLSDRKRVALKSLTTEGVVAAAMFFPSDSAVLAGGRDAWFSEANSMRLRAVQAGPDEGLLLEAQFQGARANALAGKSESTALTLALRAFGEALEVMPDLSRALWTGTADWVSDPLSLGAVPLPTSTAYHLGLAESQSDTLFFAGDATVVSDVGTVRGAYNSGIRAARELALSLNLDPLPQDPNDVLFELL